MKFTTRALTALLLLVTFAASGSQQTTEGLPSYELHAMPANTIVSPWPPTEADCLARARASAGEWQCVTRRNFKTVITCADEKAPHIYLEQIDLDGTKAWDLPPFQWIGDNYTEQEWLYVHGPKWPDGYPNCWVRGWEDPTLWRENPKAEPGKVFLERIEPGMTAADVELPDEMQPVCKPDGPNVCPGVPLT